jgi:hypothetical protein
MLSEDDLTTAIGGEHRRIFAQAVYLRYVAADETQTYARISQGLGVTRQAIQLRCKKGLRMLRHPSRRRFVCTYVPLGGLLWQALFQDRDARCS